MTEPGNELDAARQRGELALSFPKVGKRCFICRDDGVQKLVNDMLAYGMGYPQILDALAPINATRAPNRQITKASLYNHKKEHFDLQRPAQAIYRRRMEERAIESLPDYEEGVSNLVNAASVFDLIMRKGVETIVHDDTDISVEQTMRAAKELNEIMKDSANVEQMAAVHAQLNRVIRVMREVVPSQYHQQIMDILEGRETLQPVLDAQVDEDEGFDDLDDEGDDDD